MTTLEPTTTEGSRYLDLMKRVLTRFDLEEGYRPLDVDDRSSRGRRLLVDLVCRQLRRRGLDVVRLTAFDPDARREGRDRPAAAETMIGLKRLDNLENCIRDVLNDGVPGDLMEVGAWRGGATIFMRAALEALGDPDRRVWVADSFDGLPRPDPEEFPADAGDTHWTRRGLAVSLEEVRRNFDRYGLLDDRVCFLKGWFRDTLPGAPVERLAVLRLDGDMYESTIVALRALYHRVSPGGYVIVDDYGALESCRRAVEDFRTEHGVTEEIATIDWTGAFWRRSR